MSGARALPWKLYLQSNDWMMNQGSGEGIYGCAFAKTTVNLACRGDNTGQICVRGTPVAYRLLTRKGTKRERMHYEPCFIIWR